MEFWDVFWALFSGPLRSHDFEIYEIREPWHDHRACHAVHPCVRYITVTVIPCGEAFASHQEGDQ